MSNRRRTRDIALAVVIAAIFALEIGGVLTQQVARPHLAAYLIQLFATFIGAVLAVAIGLLLFDYQTEETDERRRRQLLEALAGELQATRDVLESSPSSIQLQPPKEVGAQGEAAVEIVLTHVEPVVCEQAMRAAVFSSKDTFGLSHLAREMRLYNDAVNVFDSKYWAPATTKREAVLFEAAKGVKHHQDAVISWCQTIIEGLREEGIEAPPRYYSKEASREEPNNTRNQNSP